MIMSIGSNLWLPIALSLVAFGSFSWALRGHFETSIRIPNGMRLLSFFSFFSYMTFIGLLVWRGSESPVRTALGLVGFAVSITLFWWTVSTTRPHRLAVAYTNAVPDIIYVEGPYARVRHPFYLSYILFWFATAVVADQWQWAPALILIFWYIRVARGEERRFRSSALSTAYDAYRGRTGMFLPRLGLGGR
jgi:protein-S-isoprenylcysteine O-methyltransferase Ste14